MLIEIALILGIAVLLCVCVDYLRVADPANKVFKIVIVALALWIAIARSGVIHTCA